MDRMQIYLRTEQRLRLAALARTRGSAVAELIRAAIDRFLDAEEGKVPATDGLFALVGAAGALEKASDVSTRHHDYLRDYEHGVGLAVADAARAKHAAASKRATKATRGRVKRSR